VDAPRAPTRLVRPPDLPHSLPEGDVAALAGRLRRRVYRDGEPIIGPETPAERIYLDMCGGRLTIGIGAGWHQREYEAYGFPWASGGARVARLDEALHTMKAMWQSDDCPSPRQQPHPPIWVGGQGPALLRVAAKHADAWNAPVLTTLGSVIRAGRCRRRSAYAVGYSPRIARSSRWIISVRPV
jgi:hypothetical protein